MDHINTSSDSDNNAAQRPSRWATWRLKRRRTSSFRASDDSVEQDSDSTHSDNHASHMGEVVKRRQIDDEEASDSDADSSEAAGNSDIAEDVPVDNAADAGVQEDDNVLFAQIAQGDVQLPQDQVLEDTENEGSSDSAEGSETSSSSSQISVPDEEDLIVEHAAEFIEPADLGPVHANEVQIPQPANSDASDTSTDSAGEENEGYDYEEDSGEENLEVNREEDILYEGAPLSLNESLLCVLTLAVKHSLTGKCIADILGLIQVHCPQYSHCISSLYKFKKYFSMIGSSTLKFHHYCAGCIAPLENRETICDSCRGANKSTLFIEIPLKYQLQSLMKRPNFFQDLQYRFQRVKKNPNNVEDIYDGKMYMDHFGNNGFLSNSKNISLCWYTDGVPVYHTSKFSMWPLFFRINELSPKKRVLKENTILAGLWFGSTKPNPNVYFSPFHSSLTEFHDQGYEIQYPGAAPINMKGILLMGVADLPAKSTVMRFKQFNGAFGCSRCVTEGQRFNVGNGSVQVYPYTPQNVLRNNDDIEAFATEAVQLRQRDPHASVFGVQGPSLLYYMMPNMIRGTGIDKMHCLEGGVGKQVTTLLLDPCYSQEAFSISRLVRNVDHRLNEIRPPSFVQRMPASIEKHISLWHAQDYRHWLMYYSVPVLLGLLDPEYLQHHCLLLSAAFLLNQISISQEQIQVATELLHLYVSRFQELYGLRHVGMNVHQLLHLGEVVQDLGPLWCYACYSYEDLNGKLGKLIHGTRHAALQLCSAACIYMNLSVMIRQLPENSETLKFCERLNTKEKCIKIADEISSGIYAVGTYFTGSNAAQNETRQALQNVGVMGGHVKYFHRLRKHGIMHYSCSYPREIQKESSYVEVLYNDVPMLGRVQNFVKWSNCGHNYNADCQHCLLKYFCTVNIYERQHWFIHTIPLVRLPYLNKVIQTEQTVFVPIESLMSLCFYIRVDENQYMATPVNLLEGD